MPLQIPRAFHKGLRALNKLSTQTVDGLVTALEGTKPSFDINSTVSLASAGTSLGNEEAREVIELLIALYSVWEQSDLPAARFAEEIAESLSQSGVVGKPNATEDFRPLVDHLSRLMTLKNSLSVTAKALSMMVEHQRVFRGARVISDLRPIFGDSPNERPAISTVVHTLKIEFNERERTKLFFVALDLNDLQALRQAIERAEEKERSLREFSESSGLTCPTVEPLKN